MSVVRFGVSREQELINALDNYVSDNHLANGLQSIKHLINNNLVEKKWQCNNIVDGSVTLVYSHHKRDILNNLTDIQHDYNDAILSSQHFHLNHDNCMKIITVKGKVSVLIKLSDKLQVVKGIQYGKVNRAN